MKRFSIRDASRDELDDVLCVQHRAFGRVADAFGVDRTALPPLNETIADLEHGFDEGIRFFVAVSDHDRIVGSVRAAEHSGTVEIGRLVVDDDWLRLGVATALMQALETAHPRARSFSVFTGEEATEPLGLYAKLGYSVVRREEQGAFVLVWLEKPGGSQEVSRPSPPHGIL